MPTKDYREFLFGELQDLEIAASYLGECLLEDKSTFLLGLRDVIEAHDRRASVCKKLNIDENGLCELLSSNADPSICNLAVIFETLGLQIQFAPKVEEHEEA